MANFDGVQEKNPETGYFEVRGTARLPQRMAAPAIEAAKDRIVILTHEIIVEEEKSRADAKRHRKRIENKTEVGIKPWTKERRDLDAGLNGPDVTIKGPKEVAAARARIVELTSLIEPEIKAAREHAQAHLSYLKPRRAERSELDDQVASGQKFTEVDAVKVFETNDVAYYRCDVKPREEIVGIKEYQRRPRTDEERDPLFDGIQERAARTAAANRAANDNPDDADETDEEEEPAAAVPKAKKTGKKADPPGTKRMKKKPAPGEARA